MIIAFTGAGISKASGIPTFEEQEGESIRDKLTRSFAIANPQEYQEVIYNMFNICKKAQPNDAHYALAEYNIPVLTMNVDGLHQRAGSKNVINLHGTLPNIVLYGDPAPNYSIGYDWAEQMLPGDIFLIIGTSFYTIVSESLRIIARGTGARVICINKNAEHDVRAFLENNKNSLGDFEEFIQREKDY